MSLTINFYRFGATLYGGHKGNLQRIVGFSSGRAAERVRSTEKLFKNFEGVGKAPGISERISSTGRIVISVRTLLEITLTTNDPKEPSLTVPVHITVGQTNRERALRSPSAPMARPDRKLAAPMPQPIQPAPLARPLQPPGGGDKK